MVRVVGLFNQYNEANQAVENLEKFGVEPEQISVITPENTRETVNTSGAGKGATTGAVTGAATGGLVGLLAGLGALVIPGIGPVIAAGTIASTLAGAAVGAGVGTAVGGLLGALKHSGFSNEDAEFYSEGVKRGGTLVYVSADPAREEQVTDILRNAGAVDMDTQREAWKSEGLMQYEEIEYDKDLLDGNDPERSLEKPYSNDPEYFKGPRNPEDPESVKAHSNPDDPYFRPPLV